MNAFRRFTASLLILLCIAVAVPIESKAAVSEIDAKTGESFTVELNDDNPGCMVSFTAPKTAIYGFELLDGTGDVSYYCYNTRDDKVLDLKYAKKEIYYIKEGEKFDFELKRSDNSEPLSAKLIIDEEEFGALFPYDQNGFVEKDQDVTFVVYAHSKYGGLKYVWTDDKGNTVGTESKFTFKAAATGYYYCEVTDAHGNEIKLTTRVQINNHLTIYDMNSTIYVKPGDDVLLKPTVTGDDLSALVFDWRYTDKNTKIPGATGATLKLTNVTESKKITVYVEDQYESRSPLTYKILIDNGLQVSVDGAREEDRYNDDDQIFIDETGKYTVKLNIKANDMSGVTVRMSDDAGKVWHDTDKLEVDMSSGKKIVNYEVTDKYKTTIKGRVQVYTDNNFSVGFPDDVIFVAADGTANLRVFVDGKSEDEVTFKWDMFIHIDDYSMKGRTDIDCTSSSLKLKKPEGSTTHIAVYCFVKSVRSGLTKTAKVDIVWNGDDDYNAPTPTPASAAKPTTVAKPTTAAEPTTAGKPTSAPTTAPSSDPKGNVMAFVERIYTYVLNREPEADGAAFWSDELWSFRRTGAEVAQGFIFSEEFENRKTSDDEFLTILYRTFFNREPDEGGMDYWRSQLKSGTMDRTTVANGFIYSQEWADTCAAYGIRSGGELKPTSKIEPTALTYGFVERMYTTALGRGYDEEGKQYWASCLADFETTGEVVGAFFFLSDEMVSYKLSDKEYLTRLYATFMDREPDNDGMTFWLDFMKTHERQETVLGFTRSPEFTDKCIEARILPY